MSIIVTNHAVNQYKQKMFSTLSNTEIQKILKITAERGTNWHKRPGNAYSVKYNGINIVVVKQEDTLTVVTCLGDNKYAEWSKKNDIRPRYKTAAV